MSIVTLQLPEVKACETSRPKKCPTCGGETFQRWGGAAHLIGQHQCGEPDRGIPRGPVPLDASDLLGQYLDLPEPHGLLLGASLRSHFVVPG